MTNYFIVKNFCSSGSIRYWLNDLYKNKCHMSVASKKNVHVSHISAIDATSEYVISGSNSGLIKVRFK